jgi:hypothetical protein
MALLPADGGDTSSALLLWIDADALWCWPAVSKNGSAGSGRSRIVPGMSTCIFGFDVFSATCPFLASFACRVCSVCCQCIVPFL